MKMNKRKKKKGFTLIEAGAVVCIMLMLMTFFVPKVAGYINDAKKASIMAQAKTLVFAWETINSRETQKLGAEVTKDGLKKFENKYAEYFDLSETKGIHDETEIKTCMEIIKGSNYSFDNEGKIVLDKKV
ncbi:hypothetical protein [Clostridium thermobutyricum]|uniref:type II secretion system protein n=1 Tax=Clostridium thermobutyricum TaxID=29372 RepID=UPI00294354B9|nr:hypothetical protein [Clostridium thermobutyricum]